MTFTYSSTDLSTTLARVRLLIGDTDSADQQLTDEEIDYFTDTHSSPFFAAAAACDALAASYSRRPTKSVGPLSISYGELTEKYTNLAARLRYQGTASGASLPYTGGISDSDKTTREADTDRTKPQFLLGMDDYPGTGPGRSGSASSS